jgi:hypothetical protein
MVDPEKPGEFNPRSQEAFDQVGTVTMDELPTLLQMLNYPVSRDTVVKCFGRLEIQWSQMETFTLQDAVRDLPETLYEDLGSLMDALCDGVRLAYGEHLEPDEQIIDR